MAILMNRLRSTRNLENLRTQDPAQPSLILGVRYNFERQ